MSEISHHIMAEATKILVTTNQCIYVLIDEGVANIIVVYTLTPLTRRAATGDL